MEAVLKVESELRRQGQELAVAWRRGKAAYVLDSLAKETPMRASVLAALIQELLARWDPLDGKWHVGFWRALVSRSEGLLTGEEMEELTRLYRRKFGRRPPRPEMKAESPPDPDQRSRSIETLARRIREALEEGVPIPRVVPPPSTKPNQYLRSRRASP